MPSPSDPDPGYRLAQLVRLLLVAAASVGLLITWLLSQAYWPARLAPQTALATEATEGAPPPGSYHRPAVPAPDTATIPNTAAGRDIRYGRALVARTAHYLGPSGTVGHFTNGMNCQNCHLDAGTRGFANNYLAVAATYPKLRARSGTVESITRRVTDCVERSLNGRALPPDSREQRALVAYLTWLGQGFAKGKKAYGTGLTKLSYLARAADPVVGQTVYAAKCQHCHGPGGQGQFLPAGNGYQYPPLWGPSSYTDAAGLYRLSTLARYVKAAMPYGATFDRPQLTDAQGLGCSGVRQFAAAAAPPHASRLARPAPKAHRPPLWPLCR
jgi:thiosulfate dehydrogenase